MGSSTRFLKKVSHGVSLSASPKQPQSSTGSSVALSSVSSVKKIIEASAKIEMSRMRTLKSSMQPIISSAPHSQIEKVIDAGSSASMP